MTTAERMATALETIAAGVADPNEELVAKVVQLESITRSFVSLMKNPQSTNEEWAALLEDAMEALDIEEGVPA